MANSDTDQAMLREWQAMADALLENLPIDAARVREAEGGSLETVAAATRDGDSLVGDRVPRDGRSCCDALLDVGTELVAGADDADWANTAEAADGYQSYLGAALLWPEAEAYGTISLLSREALDEDATGRCMRLLQRMAISGCAQLAVRLRREQGHYEATHDALTGLPNRQLFNDLAGMQMKVAQRNSSSLWLVLWSIDGFQDYAEERGREAVNGMLGRVAERARSCIRQSDILARLGDNQFVFLIAGANEFVANSVAERLRRNLSTLTAWPEHSPTTVTGSCGLTPYRADENLEDWLARARAAMEDAASTGGNTAMVRER